jgi:hypothetical protein
MSDYKELLLRRLVGVEKSNWKDFTYIVAYLTDTKPWNELSEEFKKTHGLPDMNIGIDLANDNTAILCRYYGKAPRITFNDISMFLAGALHGPHPFENIVVATMEGVEIENVLADDYTVVRHTNIQIEEVLAKTKGLLPIEGRLPVDKQEISRFATMAKYYGMEEMFGNRICNKYDILLTR